MKNTFYKDITITSTKSLKDLAKLVLRRKDVKQEIMDTAANGDIDVEIEFPDVPEQLTTGTAEEIIRAIVRNSFGEEFMVYTDYTSTSEEVYTLVVRIRWTYASIDDIDD